MTPEDREQAVAAEFEHGFERREDGRERLDRACEAGPRGVSWDYTKVEEAYQLLTEAADQLAGAVLLAEQEKVRRVQLRHGKSQKVDDLRCFAADCQRDAARAALLLEAQDHGIELLRRGLTIAGPVRRDDHQTCALKGRSHNNLGYELMRRNHGPEDLAEADSLLRAAHRWYGRGGHRDKQVHVKANQDDLERLKRGEAVEFDHDRGFSTGPPITAHTGTMVSRQPAPPGPGAWLMSDDPTGVMINGVRFKLIEGDPLEMEGQSASEVPDD